MDIVVQNALPLRVDDEQIPAVVPPVDTRPIPRIPRRRLQYGLPEFKRCRTCDEVKPADEFLRDPNSRDKLMYRCKLCNRNTKRREHQELSPEQKALIKDRHLQRTYGLTLEQQYEMIAAQDGCAICGDKAPSGRGWAVDHDHETGKIRGILCNGCNTALGGMKDSPEILAAAIEYLRKYGK